MPDRCRAFERRVQDPRSHAARQVAWKDHLRSCASCRAQEAADRALRGLYANAARPELPPRFAERCASRARRAAAPACAPGARQRLILRAYWVLALAISAVVLVRTSWPALTPLAGAAAAVTLATILVPVLLLASLRGGVLVLVRRVLTLG